jgi:hypothetical protein
VTSTLRGAAVMERGGGGHTYATCTCRGDLVVDTHETGCAGIAEEQACDRTCASVAAAAKLNTMPVSAAYCPHHQAAKQHLHVRGFAPEWDTTICVSMLLGDECCAHRFGWGRC